MTGRRIPLRDAEATDHFGARLAPALKPGDVVCLIGALGAGKSALARAIITTRLAADGRSEDAPSPTYTLVQSYDTSSAEIVHADLYRLASGADLEELGLDEAADEAILLIEWPDRLGASTPPRRLELSLEIPAADEGAPGRLLDARFFGSGWDAVEAAVAETLE